MKSTQYRTLLAAIYTLAMSWPYEYRRYGITLGDAVRRTDYELSIQSVGRRAREAVTLGLLSVSYHDAGAGKNVAHYKLTAAGRAYMKKANKA